MMIKNKKEFLNGIILSLSFLVVLSLIFSPIFGEGRNGLEFSDDLFNKLSKGSSYFIPGIIKKNEGFLGRNFSVDIKMKTNKEARNLALLLETAGAKTLKQGLELKIDGDLGLVLSAILRDAEAMYNNEGTKVTALYGYDEKDVMKNWWRFLTILDKEFKKELKISEAKHVSEVCKKAVEPSYNFYGIQAQNVMQKALLMTGLLIFYVIYTIWWGLAILYLLEGLGLEMSKAKVKKEM